MNLSVTELVDRLRQIREKHGFLLTDEAERETEEICLRLVELGHWPARSNNTIDESFNRSARQMYEGYGINWHQWEQPWWCVHCEADLCRRDMGPPFKREIGITDTLRDCITHFICPDCKKTIIGRDSYV